MVSYLSQNKIQSPKSCLQGPTRSASHTHHLSYLPFISLLPSERTHFHCSSNRASQFLPQGLCTCCSLPRTCFPQLLACLYYTLLSGLCSNVTLSEELSLTKLFNTTLFYHSIPLLSCFSFLLSTHHHLIYVIYLCLSSYVSSHWNTNSLRTKILVSSLLYP